MCWGVAVGLFFVSLLPKNGLCDELLESPPKIMGIENSRKVIKSDSPLTLTCSGRSNITWDFFHFLDSGNIQLSWQKESNSSEYITTLQINKALWNNTGNYTCAYQKNQTLSASVYVFVENTEYLFLPFSDGEDEEIEPLYTNITIPCRPTSPNVNITLLQNDKIVNMLFVDPTEGVTVYLNEEVDNVFTCIGTLRGYKQELTYTVVGESVPIPEITDESETHFVGQQLKLLCKVEAQNIYLHWNLPENVHNQDNRLVTIENQTQTVLLLSNLSVADSGTYTCLVRDHWKNCSITISVMDTPYIKLKSDNTSNPIEVKVGRKALFVVNVDAYPPAKFKWFHNNHLIRPNFLYNISSTTKWSKLEIENTTIPDSGLYTLRAINENDFNTINMTLLVPDKPCVSVSGPSFILLNSRSQFYCTAVGNPKPEVRWLFKECLINDNCPQSEVLSNETDVSPNGLTVTSVLTVNTNVSGTLYCVAENSVGNDTNLKEAIITDIPDGFNVWKSVEYESVGDALTLYCGASKHSYSGLLNWYFSDGDQPIRSDERFQVHLTETKYSHQKNIIIKNLTKEYNGDYRCADGGRSSSLVLIVLDPEQPKITDSNLKGKETKVKEGLPHHFYCHASGIPIPTIVWKKNNRVWKPHPPRSRLSADNQTVSFISTMKDDEGMYSCVVSNRLQTLVDTSFLAINDSKTSTPSIIWIISLPILFIIILIIAIAFVFIKLRNEKRRILELNRGGLDNFEEGDVDCINPNLPVDDQADLLPFYNEWEFPRENLKLDKVLGSGAFGIVRKAEALGILTEGETTIVAVKTMKSNVGSVHIRALTSELKILSHLGHHVNVVNLLGACTKNLVSKNELYVIVEYCRYGNLLNYLQRHRRDFVNQIDPSSGEIDTSIKPTSSEHNVQVVSNVVSGSYDDQGVTVVSTSSRKDAGVLTSTNGNTAQEQPEWQTNYQGDYRGNVAPMCSQDLLCWAFQVARGMDYLVSRNILHGDLAARNILLADNDVVKICDFGLSRTLYKDANYVKKESTQLPVRWMAIESIRDRIFSIQSDIWSFGVVLWEIFTLGQQPYAAVQLDEKFYQKLEQGLRLSKPEFATKQIYQLMLQCWKVQPKKRPLFRKLIDDIGTMLEKNVREHYSNLKTPYSVRNDSQNASSKDYLAMMRSPDFEALTSGHVYVNELMAKKHISTRYLNMASEAARSNSGDRENTECREKLLTENTTSCGASNIPSTGKYVNVESLPMNRLTTELY